MCLLPPDKAKAREACFCKHTLSGRVVELRLRGLPSNQKYTRDRIRFIYLHDSSRFLTRFMFSWNLLYWDSPGPPGCWSRKGAGSALHLKTSELQIQPPTANVFHTRCSSLYRPLRVHASPSSVPRTRCAALCSVLKKSFFCKSISELHPLPNRMNYINGEGVLMFICYPLQQQTSALQC